MQIAKLQCDQCDYEIYASQAGYPYVIWDGGEYSLPHPIEETSLKEYTGLMWREAMERGILQRKAECLCFACAAQFRLDVDREIKRCPKCASYEVRTFRGAINARCPSCNQGMLKHEFIGIA